MQSMEASPTATVGYAGEKALDAIAPTSPARAAPPHAQEGLGGEGSAVIKPEPLDEAEWEAANTIRLDKRAVVTERVVIKDQGGNLAFYTMKKGAKIGRILEYYMSSKMDMGIKFLFEGNRIRPDQTLAQLEYDANHMHNFDIIDAVVEQIGGSSAE